MEDLEGSAKYIISLAGAATILWSVLTWLPRAIRRAWKWVKRRFGRMGAIQVSLQSLAGKLDGIAGDVAMERTERRAGEGGAMYEMRRKVDSRGGEWWECVFVSAAFTDLTGLNRDQCHNHGWIMAVCEEQREDIRYRVEYATAQCRVFAAHYPVCNVATGATASVFHRSTPAMSDNEAVGWIGTYHHDRREKDRPAPEKG